MMTRAMRSWRIVAVAVAAAAATLATAGSPVTARPESGPRYPLAKGVTTITATGNKGITLRLPRHSRISDVYDGNVKVKVKGADAAYVVMAPHYCGGPRNLEHFYCAGFQFWRISESWSLNDFYYVPSSEDDVRGFLHKGLVDVYLMSEGRTTFTVVFDGLEGRTRLKAAGKIDAVLERLPIGCPAVLPDCDNIGYGGTAHRMRGLGLVSAISYSEVPEYPVPDRNEVYVSTGTLSTQVCLYPGYFAPDESPEPEDHPYGCEYTPGERQDAASEDWRRNLIGHACCLLARGTGTGQNHWADEPGKYYAGYTAHSRSASGEVFGGDRYGAFAAWLHKGIRCRSGDFRRC